jgi:hypothetical protein
MPKRNSAAVAARQRKAGPHSKARRPVVEETECAVYCPFCGDMVLEPHRHFIARRGQTFSFCDTCCLDEWMSGGYRD